MGFGPGAVLTAASQSQPESLCLPEPTMVAAIQSAHRARTVCCLSKNVGIDRIGKRFASRTSSSETQSPSQVSTPQARALRSIISLYHTSENFAPVNSNEGLVQFIDDSLLFKKPPSPYPPQHSPNVLASTIRCLTLNKTILTPGETEQDLNPITSSHRIRAGNLRWLALKDALCGTSGSDIQEELPRPSRFSSKFGAPDWPGSSQATHAKPKAGLEVIQENWEIIQEMKNDK
ncbi:hypothetical protein PCANC_06714 [Puccinia coronata f. sp. avenae]|uniref:Uncharacterized protein n=1 Tax=Puccinia coronata f. sp. avenae TaxID=200324 RepID=A0A2N5VUB4_9BASI|nr:hypothetical protein PCANC_14827 [Puccinia coronata f. sp. avenae]PLW45453.1 hypothetical protein PCASD_05918 [Puccinia coronata f. sp. avenae]PLW53566.1 hypothetical protein PCANC_06714 [Puccinia coronata f. sp. avenae]